ncbi:RICIN domain-containing protein [Kitasatospora sp. NBC_00240]|uniref:RICIN domain-containing protein n=1 Tax=Kitasatospora sp. NBC_00240 TaxID=2903567 RepID=UPI002250E06D|nr:RICIN domain-containing protein [Kitasatospora sp. NBC_00240]MCX5208331.1 RICIN domain-containing protein [Kitasatospora sp. NBC_00240]
MFSPSRRTTAAALTAALLGLAVGAVSPASAAPPTGTYTVGVGSPVPYAYPNDTPSAPYVDKDGTFYFQQSNAQYEATGPRYWSFFTGTDFDTATRSSAISDFVNPANPNDKNNDTTWRCNNSPTGLEASYAPAGSRYAQKNYCDLAGVWVDPDTGDWYGLVHNEFTPQPFGDGLHYDAIDYTVSKDQGKTWDIKSHVITSPYSTTRDDNTAFPQDTFDYGDGDQRLYVDTASGYFYVYYGSRILNKGGGWVAFHEHVARAPISSKMAPGSWQKWYNGAWTQPGVGGQESNMVPVGSGSTTGYTPVSGEYDPRNTGTAAQQIAAGTMPATSPLFVMDITYNAYLGLYIGEPQAVTQDGTSPQYLYATDDLSTQKWYPIGDTGSYHTASWYRWFLDSANKTNNTIVGKSFRSYCSFECSKKADGKTSGGEYVDLTINPSSPAAAPVDPTKTYRIANGNSRLLAQVSGGSATTSLATATGSALESWIFSANGDGSYRITNSSTSQLLGVNTTTTGRGWGTQPTVTAAAPSGPSVGQQWWVIPGTTTSGAATGTFKLVNRHSGLVIGLSSDSTRLTETTPTRSWTNTTGNTVGGTRTASEQTLTLTQTGPAPEVVTVTNPGNRSGNVNTAVSLQLSSNDSAGRPLTLSATGLPAGLSISSAGLITGTPTTAGSSTVTVTASSGTATGTTSFTWTVNSVLSGTHTLTTGGRALDDPNHSLSQNTQLITWSTNGGTNQNWVLTQQPDGSYQLVNGLSNLCMDVSGNSTSAGAQIIQWPCNGGNNQHWVITPITGGYTVTSKSSGLLLTTASTSDGALVTQQTDTGSTLQHWTIN